MTRRDWIAVVALMLVFQLAHDCTSAVLASASRPALEADSPSLPGEMTTERVMSLPLPDLRGRTEVPTDPAVSSVGRAGAADPVGRPTAGLRAGSTPARGANVGTSQGIPAATPAVGSDGALTAARTPDVAAQPTIAQARAWARARLSARQWACLDALVQRESRWNPLAVNRRSGALGLMQTYPASRLDSFGDRHDPLVQIRWGLAYLHGRYGGDGTAGACNALDHALRKGWF